MSAGFLAKKAVIGKARPEFLEDMLFNKAVRFCQKILAALQAILAGAPRTIALESEIPRASNDRVKRCFSLIDIVHVQLSFPENRSGTSERIVWAPPAKKR